MNWMGGGLGDLLSQASKMKDEVQRIQESMGQKTTEGSAGGGMVKVIANGKLEILSIHIEPEVLKMGDPTLLQDLLRGAVNEALKNARGLLSDEMGKFAGSLGPLASLLKGFGV